MPQDTLFSAVADRLRAADVFDSVEPGPPVSCRAKGSAAPAWYRLGPDAGALWLTWATPDRWLSHSIEADLLNTGDKLEDLLEEEFAEFKLPWGRLRSEHFRSDDKEFVFRFPLPVRAEELANAARADEFARSLLALEACFRPLGDMEQDAE
jgi:hypothetical protein